MREALKAYKDVIYEQKRTSAIRTTSQGALIPGREIRSHEANALRRGLNCLKIAASLQERLRPQHYRRLLLQGLLGFAECPIITSKCISSLMLLNFDTVPLAH